MTETIVSPESSAPGQEAMVAARAEFARLRSRIRRGLWLETLAVAGLLFVAYAVPTFVVDRFLRLELAFRAAILLSFLAVLVVQVRRRLLRPLAVRLDDDEIALAVERRAPEVHEALISSLQFDRRLRTGGHDADSRELMAAVVADTAKKLPEIPFANAIDRSRVRRHLVGLLGALLFFATWAGVDFGSLATWTRRNLLLGSVDWPRYTTLAFADSTARLPQGDPLTVRVVADGRQPEQVFLFYEFAGGESGVEPMSATGDGEFTLTLESVLENVVLRAEGGDARPVELRVSVLERPRLEDLVLSIDYPTYMEREPEDLAPTDGDVRLPRGATIRLRGRSHGPIGEAFAKFGDEIRVPLQREPDGRGFHGELKPEESGLLVVDVVDAEGLGLAAPPRFLLRVRGDEAPQVSLRLRGIGSLISAHARIPGDLQVRDDFGLRAIDASVRITAATSGEEEGSAEAPFENAAATYDLPLTLGALRFETPVTVDLRQWNPDDREDGAKNRIHPGMVFSLRYGAIDNFGPGDPHHGYTEVVSFRVVTRERLQEDLRRRQVEQRGELEKIIEEHEAALMEFRELSQIVLQNAYAGREKQVAARLSALSRQQTALGRRAAFVAESYQRILLEYENNRLIDSPKVRQMEALITAPLGAVAREAFPDSGRRIRGFREAREERLSNEVVDGYIEIARRLRAVLTEMEQAETLAAILEGLRSVIKIEDSVRHDVEGKAREAEESLFGPGEGERKKDPDEQQPPKRRNK